MEVADVLAAIPWPGHQTPGLLRSDRAGVPPPLARSRGVRDSILVHPHDRIAGRYAQRGRVKLESANLDDMSPWRLLARSTRAAGDYEREGEYQEGVLAVHLPASDD